MKLFAIVIIWIHLSIIYWLFGERLPWLIQIICWLIQVIIIWYIYIYKLIIWILFFHSSIIIDDYLVIALQSIQSFNYLLNQCWSFLIILCLLFLILPLFWSFDFVDFFRILSQWYSSGPETYHLVLQMLW